LCGAMRGPCGDASSKHARMRASNDHSIKLASEA
jgi:hypothetical protein